MRPFPENPSHLLSNQFLTADNNEMIGALSAIRIHCFYDSLDDRKKARFVASFWGKQLRPFGPLARAELDENSAQSAGESFLLGPLQALDPVGKPHTAFRRRPRCFHRNDACFQELQPSAKHPTGHVLEGLQLLRSVG